MLKLTFVPKGESEYWDYKKEEFVTLESFTIELEHSLVAISKWESKYHKPFLHDNQKSEEEMLYYIRCMVVNGEPTNDQIVAIAADKECAEKIMAYIEDPMTATTIKKQDSKANNGEFVTSELIYYWMTSCQIPFECQYWHINRLIKLIEICSIKNQPSKKMSHSDQMAMQRAEMAKRRAKSARKH